MIKTRWGALPLEQREVLKTYVSNMIIKLSTDDRAFRQERVFLNKLNLVLVDILKQARGDGVWDGCNYWKSSYHPRLDSPKLQPLTPYPLPLFRYYQQQDWPHRWPTFIPDIVGASQTNANLCENSMVILRLLSEEVFDFSDDLTTAKTRELKSSFNEQFAQVHQLCLAVLNGGAARELVRATLATLNAFLSWVPLGYIFESNVVDVLLRLLPQPPLRNLALQCLTEVGSLSVGAEYTARFQALFHQFMALLAPMLPADVDIAAAYAAGGDDDQAFVQNLAMFFTAFLRTHVMALEATEELQGDLLAALDYLVRISYVDDDEVFKTCLDYWNFFVPEVYSFVCTTAGTETAQFAFGGAPISAAAVRRRLYEGVLRKLRALMIARMAKPEEVIVVEDENGNIVRESMKDTDVLARYKTMHETLVYLSHLDHEDTERQMLEKLRLQQLNGGEWGWGALNRLCWAIGSISGSMVEDQENRFLVTVIRDLLNLTEITRGKDNKAVIASNIMYVVWGERMNGGIEWEIDLLVCACRNRPLLHSSLSNYHLLLQVRRGSVPSLSAQPLEVPQDGGEQAV